MIKIISLVSREWSKKITLELIKKQNKSFKIKYIFLSKDIKFDHKSFLNFKHIEPKSLEDEYQFIDSQKPDLILAYGWSYLFSKKFTSKYKVLVLHPSKLPAYKGGSPIQNQIINGVKKSAVTILLANSKIDSGPIIFQQKLSLNGELNYIFKKIISIGIIATISITNQIKNKRLKLIKQEDVKSTYHKRRSPNQSEIKLKDFKKYEAEYLYNKIRCLQKPYPRPYIKCKNNTKIFLEKASLK